MSSGVGTSAVHPATVENIVLSKWGRSYVAQCSKYLRQKPQATSDSFRAVGSTAFSRRRLFDAGHIKGGATVLVQQTNNSGNACACWWDQTKKLEACVVPEQVVPQE